MNRSLLTALLVASGCTAAVAFQPIADLTDLESVGIYATGHVRTDGTQTLYAPGPEGHDEATGTHISAGRPHQGKTGVFMHPPYRNKSEGGVAFQEFTVTLPSSPAATVTGFTSLTEESEKSDGVTYRVRVNGAVAWEEHRRTFTWLPFTADLAKWAGQTVQLRFEVSPGPRNNTGWDAALWGGRTLTLPGFRGPTHPPPPPLDLGRLSSRQNKSWAPLNGFDGDMTVKLEGDCATLHYEGRDGELDYVWKTSDETSPFGSFLLRARMNGDREYEIPLLSGAAILWTNKVKLAPTTVRKRRSAIEFDRTFETEDPTFGGPATLNVTARLEQKNLILDIACDKPWIGEFSPGNWGPVAIRRKIPMPYYGHPVEYLPAENLFVSRFPDWTASQATSFRDERAYYGALTDGSRNKLRERVIFSAAWHLDEVLANIPNPPSPWREYMGRRIVLDIWNGGPFDNTASSLVEMAKSGVRDDYIIFHVWQRDGYDNGLPAHFPARDKQGGDEAMRRLTAKAKELGHRLALHENYVDYYPNYEHFTTNDISLNSDGSLEKAWYNPGTKIQSFAVKPGAIMRLAREQSPEIHKRYGTDAGYLDVHSCVPLWFHVDQRAGEPDAGSLQAVWKVHRELFQFSRDTHRGPETGEGNGHWPWSGWLDGVEAQFGTGWPWGEGLAAPLLADFNLLRVHPLQINHGQGYYERWYGHTKPWGDSFPVAVFDQYRMQEIVFGHIGFLGHDFWRKPNVAWLEQHLVPPVSARHATARLRDVAYHTGGIWTDTTEAVKRGAAAGLTPQENFGRVRIVYDNGLTIVANGLAADFVWDGWTLPPFGWIATNRDFAAGTIRRDGVVVDFVDSPDHRFANARRLRDWNMGGPLPVRVGVAEFQSLENRRIRFSYDWKTGLKLHRDLRCFVHFDKPGKHHYDSEIVAQQDHDLKRKTTEWSAGETLRDGPHEMTLDLPDGRYMWRIGLWDKQGRLPLDGPSDGTGRIRLGDLVVSGGGQKIRFEPEQPMAMSAADLFRQNVNLDEKEIDFGFVKTNGSVLLRREGRTWKKLTFPPEG